MKYSEGKLGRVFVIRLEDKDRLPQAIESFAEENKIQRGMCILVGGIQAGGKIVVGPEESTKTPIVPTIFTLSGVHEVLGVGAVFPDDNGKPRLHMHAALGREGKSRTGCIRPGIEVWKVGEVIFFEIKDNSARRKKDASTGFELLEVS